MKRYAALEAVLSDLEERLKGAQVRWVDREGPHVGSWGQFRHFVFSHYGPNGEPPEVCNLLEFNMDQLDALHKAQQMAACMFLHGIGFPSMELIGEVWHDRHGLVKLEEAQKE